MRPLSRGPGGHLVKNAAGHLTHCATDAACGNCADSTPTSFTLTFSGTNYGSVSCFGTSPGAIFFTGDGSIDGTFCLKQFDGCSWGYAESTITSLSAHFYSDAGCTAEFISVFIVRLVKLPGILRVGVAFGPGACEQFSEEFVGTWDIATDNCADTISGASLDDYGGFVLRSSLAGPLIGGTVTVTPNATIPGGCGGACDVGIHQPPNPIKCCVIWDATYKCAHPALGWGVGAPHAFRVRGTGCNSTLDAWINPHTFTKPGGEKYCTKQLYQLVAGDCNAINRGSLTPPDPPVDVCDCSLHCPGDCSTCYPDGIGNSKFYATVSGGTTVDGTVLLASTSSPSGANCRWESGTESDLVRCVTIDGVDYWEADWNSFEGTLVDPGYIFRAPITGPCPPTTGWIPISGLAGFEDVVFTIAAV